MDIHDLPVIQDGICRTFMRFMAGWLIIYELREENIRRRKDITADGMRHKGAGSYDERSFSQR